MPTKKKATRKSSPKRVTKPAVQKSSLTSLTLMTLVLFLALLTVLNFLSKRPQEVTTSTLPQNASSLTAPRSTTYIGKLPCADCPGIKTEITLNKDKTFMTSEIYLERNDEKPVITNGTWEIVKDTSVKEEEIVYKLTADDGQSGPLYYLLTTNGNELKALDNTTMQPITAEDLNFTLTKKTK